MERSWRGRRAQRLARTAVASAERVSRVEAMQDGDEEFVRQRTEEVHVRGGRCVGGGPCTDDEFVGAVH